MPDTVVKASVILSRATGLPEDTVINTFYFFNSSGVVITSGDADDLRDRLVSFYNDVHAPGIADIASSLSEALVRTANASRIDFYEQPSGGGLTPWGSPVFTRNWTLDAASAGTPFPSEVAACLSFNADLTDIPETAVNPSPPPATIRPAARLRGRLFIGPFQEAAGAEDPTTHENQITAATRNQLAGAGEALIAANTADLTWGVLSRVDATISEVVGGFVDINWDSQRRRGATFDFRQDWP